MSWMTLIDVARAVPAEPGTGMGARPTAADLTHLYARPASMLHAASPAKSAPSAKSAKSAQPVQSMRGLGSASAASPWGWAEPALATVPPNPIAPAGPTVTTLAAEHRVRVEPGVLRAVATSARLSGRSEDDIWNEAAYEWLSRHGWDDDPTPTTPSSAPRPRPTRSWAGIDALLAELRGASLPESVPAA